VALRCLLDSGSGGLGVGLKTAERLRLEPFGEFNLAGIGAYATALVEAGPLMIGGATFGNARFAVVTDLPPGADLVLGSDFFASCRVRIDYPRHEVSISTDAGSASEAEELPVTYAAQRPQVALRLGALATELVIDTGDDAAINLSYGYYRKHSELFATEGRAEARGIGGASDVLTGTISSVELGSIRLARVPVVVTRRSLEPQGRIGGALLQTLVVTFDLAHDRVGFHSAQR